MIWIQVLVCVHLCNHRSYSEQGNQENSHNEQKQHIFTRSPDELPCNRTSNEPDHREHVKSYIDQPFYMLHSLLILEIVSVPSGITVYIVANLFIEQLDGNWHSQTCHHDFHTEKPIMKYEDQIASSCHDIMQSLISRIAVKYFVEVDCLAEPENVQTNHLKRDEIRNDFTRVLLVDVDG